MNDSIICEESFVLCYRTYRGAFLAPVVEGEVHEAARRFFNSHVELELLTTQTDEEGSYTSWRVKYVGKVDKSISSPAINVVPDISCGFSSPSHCSMPMEALKGMCPHFAEGDTKQIDEMRSVGALSSIGKAPSRPGKDKSDSYPVSDFNCFSSMPSKLPSSFSTPLPIIRPDASTIRTQFCPHTKSSDPGFGLSSSQLHRLFPFHIVFDRDLKITQLGKYVQTFVADIEVGKKMDDFFKVCTAPYSWQWDSLVPHAEVSEIGIKTFPFCSRRDVDISLIGNISFSDNLDSAFLLCTPNVKTFSDMVQREMNMTHLVGQNTRLEAVLQHENMMSAAEENTALQQLTKLLEEERESTFKLMQEVTDATQEALAVKKTFVRYVSHEIRTPLTVVQLGLSLLGQQVSQLNTKIPSHNDEIVENIQNCHESVDIAVSILGDLLSYEKLESGILMLNRKPVGLVKFVTAAIQPIRLLGKQRNIAVEIQPDSHVDDLYLSIDPGKMAQVVRNFLSNAVQFSPVGSTVVIKLKWVKTAINIENNETEDGSVVDDSSSSSMTGTAQSTAISSAHSRLSSSIINSMKLMRDFEHKLHPKLFNAGNDGDMGQHFSPHGHICIEFIDQGIGVTDENQSRMFNNIAQFNPEVLESAGGSGLGLYISKGIAELHGGGVSVASEGVGLGSCFTLQLPSYLLKRSVTLSKEVLQEMELASAIVKHEMTQLSCISRDAPKVFTPNLSQMMEIGSGSSIESISITSLFASKRVLIVDDAKLIRKLLDKNLTNRGAHCTLAEDGIEAVQCFKNLLSTGEQFDIILMDFVMPNMVNNQ